MTTLKDIARACGVSAVTVSDILNSKSGAASAETRERVLKAAKEMHYRPNLVARGLRNGRMNTVGVLLRYSHAPASGNPAAMILLDSVVAVNTKHRKTTILVTMEDWPNELGLSQNPALTACDGVVLAVPPDIDALKPILDYHKLPFVSIGTKSSHPDVSYVDIDNIAAAKLAVQYLISKGHRRIAFLADVDESFQFAHDRLEGYRQALREAGIPANPNDVLFGVDCFAAMPSHFSKTISDRPTALFCATDFAALAALAVLVNTCGMSVPDDISLMGFDDIPSLPTMRPALTTVKQPLIEIGTTATELLLEIVEGRERAGKKILLPAMVVERETVGPPFTG